MELDYSTDRTPVIPVALLVGDRIRAVHVEGQAPEDVDIRVEAKAIERKKGAPYGASTVCITGTDVDGKQVDRKFDNTNVWLSIERRTEPADLVPDVEADTEAEHPVFVDSTAA